MNCTQRIDPKEQWKSVVVINRALTEKDLEKTHKMRLKNLFLFCSLFLTFGLAFGQSELFFL